MGCGANKTLQYDHAGKKHVISAKNMDTIKKWAAGALARRRFKKLVLTKRLAGLKYPEYRGKDLVPTDECLFTDKELFRMTDFSVQKKLVWINYYREIGKDKQYRGQWTKDNYKSVWQGLGEIKFSDGSCYQGQTLNGLFHGRGRMTHSNGDIYQGEWKDGKANGQGVFVDTNGSMYKGEWLNDVYHGKGCETWNYNSIKYVGDFKEGQKTGKGRFEYDNNSYEGDFVEGQLHGKGIYHFADCGKTYEGQFTNNNIHGTGKMTWPDGSKYEGQFVNGKMEGHGAKTWPNGNVYDGKWKNNLQHGSGQFYSATTGKTVPEEWREGKKWTWANKGNGQSQPTQMKQAVYSYVSDKMVREQGWNQHTSGKAKIRI